MFVELVIHLFCHQTYVWYLQKRIRATREERKKYDRKEIFI